MYDYRRPAGIDTLLQDLYTPEQYNPAEYTLMGYDQYANTGMEPMYSYYNPVLPQAAPTASVEDYNRRVEEIAAENRANAPAPTPASDYSNEYLIYKLNAMGNTGNPTANGQTNVYYPEPSADKRANLWASMPTSAQLQLQNKAAAYARARQAGKNVSPENFVPQEKD